MAVMVPVDPNSGLLPGFTELAFWSFADRVQGI
jgi:hypothetical protein